MVVCLGTADLLLKGAPTRGEVAARFKVGDVVKVPEGHVRHKSWWRGEKRPPYCAMFEDTAVYEVLFGDAGVLKLREGAHTW